MDLKLIPIALFVLLAGLVNNSLANDSDDDSIDSLIERLEHVLEIQARPEHELDDITDDNEEHELESIDGELSNLRKRSTYWWNFGTFGGDRTFKKEPARKKQHTQVKGNKRKIRTLDHVNPLPNTK